MVLGTILFYVAVAINTLSYVYLIFKIWRTKSCAGLSGKTHILYAVAYTARCAAFFSTPFYYALEFKCIDVAHFVLISILILSLFVFFKKTREPQYDTYRVELLVICCFAVATMVNSQHGRFELQPVLWAFSIYLEAVAMLPQFRMISETRHLHSHIFGYIIAVAVGQFLHLMYLFCNDYYFPWLYDKNLMRASIVVQLILSLDFFLRVSPIKLQIVKASPEISIVGDQETGDGAIKSDSLKENVMSNIVLTPASLLNASAKDKVDLLKDEEAK